MVGQHLFSGTGENKKLLPEVIKLSVLLSAHSCSSAPQIAKDWTKVCKDRADRANMHGKKNH